MITGSAGPGCGDRLIFLRVTYNDDFLYRPETVSNGTAYTNTMIGIPLSLIEQRELFEGRLPQLPTVADADTPMASLALTATSSNPQVVPTSGIVFGGSLDGGFVSFSSPFMI